MEEINMLDTLLGGLLVAIPTFGAILFQSRNTRKNRMAEIVAERKVTANALAYRYMKEIEGLTTQVGADKALEVINDKVEWFFGNRLFLPGKFPSKWLSLRRDLSKLTRWQKDPSKTANEMNELETKVNSTTSEAIDEIFKNMDLKRIKLGDSDI